MSYSKGPLRISGPSQGGGSNDGSGDYAIVEPGGIIIGEAFHRVGEDVYRDAEANARLWAKAPDLLVALDVLTDAIEDYHFSGPDDRSMEEWNKSGAILKAAYEQTRAAIAGARGDNE